MKRKVKKKKKKFSRKWKASKKREKQRKYRIHAPHHVKHKGMGAHLSGELRKKYGRRAIPLKKGDVVKIMRGKLRKKQGKVSIVDAKKGLAYIEGVQRTRKDGTKVNVPVRASNLMIMTLELEDKKRLKMLERKQVKPKVGGKK